MLVFRGEHLRRKRMRIRFCPLSRDLSHTLPIEPQYRVARMNERKNLRREFGSLSRRRNAVIHPVFLAKTVKQAYIAKQFEVPGDAGLTLIQHLGDLPYSEFSMPQQR